MENIQSFDGFNESIHDIGNRILTALNSGSIKNIKSIDDESGYDTKIIYTFDFDGSSVKVENVDQIGISIFVDGSRQNIDSKISVKIEKKCKELSHYQVSNEEKKWIQDAIKHPGSLRKSLHKKKGEKITKSEIGSEVSKLRKKDRDKDKPGLQLGKNDRKKYRKLVLAKTLKSMNENSESEKIFSIEDMKRAFDIGVSVCDDLEGRSPKECQSIIDDAKNDFVTNLINKGNSLGDDIYRSNFNKYFQNPDN